jgi:hypothetical protein
VHAVAAALLERGELIGAELEDVFDRADAEHPEAAAPFERKLFTLPRLFEDRSPVVDGSQTWPGEGGDAAAASGGGVPVPGDTAADPRDGHRTGRDGEWPAI